MFSREHIYNCIETAGQWGYKFFWVGGPITSATYYLINGFAETLNSVAEEVSDVFSSEHPLARNNFRVGFIERAPANTWEHLPIFFMGCTLLGFTAGTIKHLLTYQPQPILDEEQPGAPARNPAAPASRFFGNKNSSLRPLLIESPAP